MSSANPPPEPIPRIFTSIPVALIIASLAGSNILFCTVVEPATSRVDAAAKAAKHFFHFPLPFLFNLLFPVFKN